MSCGRGCHCASVRHTLVCLPQRPASPGAMGTVRVSILKAKGQKWRRVETPVMSGEVMGESASGRNHSWGGGMVTRERVFVPPPLGFHGNLLSPADHLDHFPPAVWPLRLSEDRWTDVLIQFPQQL